MPFHLLSLFPFVFAHSQTESFYKVYWNPSVRVHSDAFEAISKHFLTVSVLTVNLHIFTVNFTVNFTSTALQLRLLPLGIPNCGFHKVVSGREIWQFIQLLIHPNIHLVFYYNIHNSHQGKKVNLLTAFKISTLPITYFNKFKSSLFSLLLSKGSGVHTLYTAHMSSKLGTGISEF